MSNSESHNECIENNLSEFHTSTSDLESPPSTSADTKSWWVVFIYLFLALIAGVVFVNYLLSPQPYSAIDFLRELRLVNLFSKLQYFALGEILFMFTYLLSAITGCLACLLAIVLCIRAGDKNRSRNLAGSLALSSFALAYICFFRPFHIENITALIIFCDVFASIILGVSLWLWMHFVRNFPQRLAIELLMKTELFSPKEYAPQSIDYKLRQLGISGNWWQRALFGDSALGGNRFKEKIYKWQTSKSSLILIIAIFGAHGLSGLEFISQNELLEDILLFLIMISIFTFFIFFSLHQLGTAFIYCDEVARRQIAWLYLGLFIFTWLAIVVSALALLGLMLPQSGYIEAGAFLINCVYIGGPPVYCFLLLVMLFISIFYRGSLDPRLVIRKSTIYGFIGLGITTLFVAIEGALSTQAILQFGLPDQSGAIITGVLTAILFGPVRNRMEAKVEGFIDRILPVSALAEGKRRTSAIVFNDISGYSTISEEDEDAALMLVSIIRQVGTKAALASNGRVVKTIGDAIMLELPTVDDALIAAKSLHEKYNKLCKQYDLPTLPAHTGIHWGEVVRATDGDIYGKNVNLASRLEGVAGPGEIVLSKAAVDQLTTADELVLMGEIELKNIPIPIECFSLNTSMQVMV